MCGPFKLSRFTKKKLITTDTLQELQEKLSESHPGIADGCGGYVFCLRNPSGIKPWYAGQANRSRLVAEALNPSNREKYNKVISERKGTPMLYLLPLLTNKFGKYARPTASNGGRSSINFLEDWLIASALQVNPNLANSKKTRMLRQLHVTGLFNPTRGEATHSSGSLKSALFR